MRDLVNLKVLGPHSTSGTGEAMDIKCGIQIGCGEY